LIILTFLLITTNDASDSFRLVRVCSRVFLLPRLVLDTPGSVHRGRDERPDHASGTWVSGGRTQIFSTYVGLQLPWWVLVSFGSYSLGSLGLGLWSFRDCPEAYAELMHVRLRHFPTSIPFVAQRVSLRCPRSQEIQEAKNDLRAKGVTVD
jgi:hypothetical protein